jgi:thiol-disulfide isomerase/thioredoxin
MNKTTGIILALVVVLGGGYFALSGGDKDAMMENKADEMVKVENTEVMAKTENEMMKDKEVMTDQKDVMAKVGVYEAYAPEKIARAETGDVVLFFHASWCPSCRGLNTDIENNLKSIPEGVSILKVDYDKEVDLKKKYGVTYQHTLVQVDKDGNLIKKWSGSGIVSEIK